MAKTLQTRDMIKSFLIGAQPFTGKTNLPLPKLKPYSLDKFMADAANKYPENVAGKYYVDNQCIDCDLCRETAPDNYKRNDDGGYSFVYKQPTTPDEEARCKEAKEGCPVEAIGDNGA
jgi:ferredoxin